jgi:hypothetical protein
MDSDLKLVLEEFTRMLCAEIREAFSESMHMTDHILMCSLPFVPAPEVVVIDDGPNFDGEPFVGLVFDVVPGFDHAAATMLNVATSLRAVQDQADPNGLDNTVTLDNTVLMEVVVLPYMVFNLCYTGVKGLGCCRVPCLASGQLHIGASTDVTPSEVHT